MRGDDPPGVILAIVGPIVLLIGVVYGMLGSQVLVPDRIDQHYIWIKKIGEPFLDQLPEWGRPPE